MSKKNRFNFGGLDPAYINYEDSKIVVQPVIFDKSVSWQQGARKGPKAIIDASRFMELYDIETKSEVYKLGIHTAGPVKARSYNDLIRRIEKHMVKFLSDEKFVVTIGGDHSISLGPINTYKDFFPELSVLHLDAHADLRDSYEGNKFSHACVVKRICEKINKIVSVGIRSMDISEMEPAKEITSIGMEIIKNSESWLKKVMEGLSDFVYVTVDVDVFDTSIMPSTGTPEPGGMTWDQVVGILKELASSKKVVGFDLVELAPSSNKAPDYLAAKLIYKFLSYIFRREQFRLEN